MEMELKLKYYIRNGIKTGTKIILGTKISMFTTLGLGMNHEVPIRAQGYAVKNLSTFDKFALNFDVLLKVCSRLLPVVTPSFIFNAFLCGLLMLIGSLSMTLGNIFRV